MVKRSWCAFMLKNLSQNNITILFYFCPHSRKRVFWDFQTSVAKASLKLEFPRKKYQAFEYWLRKMLTNQRQTKQRKGRRDTNKQIENSRTLQTRDKQSDLCHECKSR